MYEIINPSDKCFVSAERDEVAAIVGLLLGNGMYGMRDGQRVVLPIIFPSVVGVALFGFSLSYDEFARTLLTAGSYNTLPLEIFGMTTNVTKPVIYALGTLTTAFSLLIIGVFLLAVWITARRRARRMASLAKAG